MTCIPFIISMFIGSNDRYSVAVSDQICFWMIVVVLAYSIYRIRKFSKMLVQNNVFANEFLMMAHLGFFTFLALVFMTTAILTIILRGTVDGRENHQKDRKREGMYLSLLILEYFQMFGCISVIVTMLIMFIKHSKTLTKKQF